MLYQFWETIIVFFCFDHKNHPGCVLLRDINISGSYIGDLIGRLTVHVATGSSIKIFRMEILVRL